MNISEEAVDPIYQKIKHARSYLASVEQEFRYSLEQYGEGHSRAKLEKALSLLTITQHLIVASGQELKDLLFSSGQDG